MSGGHDHFRSNLAQAAEMAARRYATPRKALVTSYDPDAYAVKVMLQPDEIETGWLPIRTDMAGAGFGAYYGPQKDDQALVIFVEGDINAGECIGFCNSDTDPPPRVEAGEFHLILKGDLAHVVMKPDGSIASKGSWVHTGTLHATENITSEADVIDHSDGSSGVSMKTHRDDYNSHTHTDPQGGSSGAASPQAT